MVVEIGPRLKDRQKVSGGSPASRRYHLAGNMTKKISELTPNFARRLKFGSCKLRLIYLRKRWLSISMAAFKENVNKSWKHMSIEEIYHEKGVETILNALKVPMESKLVYQKRRYLHEFEVLRRHQGETIRQYINRFRRSQRCLKSVGIDINGTYDAESLGARLLDRSGLSPDNQRLVLVGTQQQLNFELVAESMTLQYPDFRGAPPLHGRGWS